MSILSLIIAFPSFWFSGFAALNFDSFKGEKTSAWSGLCLQICLSLPHTCFYFIPVTQSSHLFLSHFYFFFSSFSLDISKGHPESPGPLFSRTMPSTAATMATLNTSSQKKFPASLGWNIFQACKIFTAFRCNKSLQSKRNLFFFFFSPKSYTVSTWYIFTGMKKLLSIISLQDRYSPMPCRAGKWRHSM